MKQTTTTTTAQTTRMMTEPKTICLPPVGGGRHNIREIPKLQYVINFLIFEKPVAQAYNHGKSSDLIMFLISGFYGYVFLASM